jgi:hypothetical protein
MSNTRIYLVAACIGGVAQPPRLIEAGTAAAARNHATRDMLSVKPASPKEVAKLIGTGIKLEIASEAPPEQQALPGTAMAGPDNGDAAAGSDGVGQINGAIGDGATATFDMPTDGQVVDAEVTGNETPAEGGKVERIRRKR